MNVFESGAGCDVRSAGLVCYQVPWWVYGLGSCEGSKNTLRLGIGSNLGPFVRSGIIVRFR